MEYTDWECYNAFLEQCTNDKSHFKDIHRRFRAQIMTCGRRLLEKRVRWTYIVPPDKDQKYLEFLEFLDGNGFIINQVQKDLYHIIPQYPETNEPDPVWVPF